MTEVNLVPDEFKTDRQRRKRLYFWMVSVLLTICAAGVISGYKYLAYARKDYTTNQIAEKYEKIQQDIMKLSQEKDQLSKWKAQLAVLGQLGSYGNFEQVIAFLAENSPELIYLEQMKLSHSDETEGSLPRQAKGSPHDSSMLILKRDKTANEAAPDENNNSIEMYLKGKALNYNAVADYLTTLKSSELFTEIKLKRSGRPPSSIKENMSVIDFEIECQLVSRLSPMEINYANLQKSENL